MDRLELKLALRHADTGACTLRGVMAGGGARLLIYGALGTGPPACGNRRPGHADGAELAQRLGAGPDGVRPSHAWWWPAEAAVLPFLMAEYRAHRGLQVPAPPSLAAHGYDSRAPEDMARVVGRSVLLFTGAGISVEAGMPDMRGLQARLDAVFDPRGPRTVCAPPPRSPVCSDRSRCGPRGRTA